jgi:aldehyde:ferredoxin oxidoreductase
MKQFTKGYAGNILRVNLSTGNVTTEPLPEELVKNYVGGRGVAAKILYDELAPGTDSFEQTDLYHWSSGRYTGTVLQSLDSNHKISFDRWYVSLMLWWWYRR